MNFNYIFILIMISFSMGCSDFLKGQKKEEEVLKFNNKKFSCLNQASETMRKIFSEESNPEKIEESLSCLEASLSYFKKRTKGTVPEGYSVQDIRAFFGNYLGDRDRVSDEMSVQMMKIKKGLFGGNEQVVMKSELQALIDIIGTIRQEVQNLKLYWNDLLVKEKSSADRQWLQKGHQALQDSIIRIILKTNLVTSEYSFSDFKSLLKELKIFTNPEILKNEEELKQFNKSIALVEATKVHLLGDVAELNSSSKWKEAIRMVLELHRMYSLYYYHFKGLDRFSPRAFKTGDEILVSSIRLLDQSWWMQKEGIPFVETQKLLKALFDQKLLPTGISDEALFEAYQATVRNFLDRDTNQKIVTLKTLAKKHITTLKSEYRGFKAVQNFNDELPDRFEYKEMIHRYNQIFSVQVDAFPEIADNFLKLSWRDWGTHLKQRHPLLYLESGELLLARDSKNSTDWSWKSLTRLNVMKFMNRLMMLSYGTERTMDLAKETLNEESMKSFYREYWKLGLELKAFDKRSGNSGKRTFFEADHFLYSSDGNQAVSLQESFELANIIFSSGLGGLTQIQNDIANSGCALSEKDHFDNPWLDENCFKKTLRKNFGGYFKNLTGLKKWVSQLGDKEWDLFYQELVDFSRTSPHTVGQIETGDLRGIVVILHYVESMYIKIDANEDDRLSVPELVAGSPRFIPFFKDLFKLKPKGPFLKETQERSIEAFVSNAFACMVITGQLPQVKTCGATFFKNAFLTKPFSNRYLILKTLNAFKTSFK